MSNRQWLKQLAASETKTWMTAVAPLGLEGKHRLETGHTIYVFEDAMCVDVARRGEDDVSGELSMIGMRVVGWLFEVEGQRRLLDRWVPGARAVLWRGPSGVLPSRIALTSRSLVLIDCSPVDGDEDEEDDRDTAEYIPVPPSPQSFVRLFPA
jgi:hypothetical protein